MFRIIPKIILITLVLMGRVPPSFMGDSAVLPSVKIIISPTMEYYGVCGGVVRGSYDIILSRHCITSDADHFILLAHEVAHWYHCSFMGAEEWEEGKSEKGARLVSQLLCFWIDADICRHIE